MVYVAPKLAKVKEQTRLPFTALYKAIGMLQKKWYTVYSEPINTLSNWKNVSNYIYEMLQTLYLKHFFTTHF